MGGAGRGVRRVGRLSIQMAPLHRRHRRDRPARPVDELLKSDRNHTSFPFIFSFSLIDNCRLNTRARFIIYIGFDQTVAIELVLGMNDVTVSDSVRAVTRSIISYLHCSSL